MKRLFAIPLAFMLASATVTMAAPVRAAEVPAVQKDKDADQDKAEKDRQKAADRLLKEAKEEDKILDDYEAEIDQAALELRASLYDDPFLQEYVNELGQSLVPSETPLGVLFSFRVIDDPEPNARALPDGRIFLNTGLLTFVQSEAELAFVLGHEIGHVIEHHFTEGIREARTRQRIGALVGAGLGALTGGLAKGKEGAVVGAVTGAAAGIIIADVTMNSYSRKQEDEADRRGVMLALDRRFDAREGGALFKRLAERFGEQDKFANALWGRHSRNVERIDNIDRLLLSGDLASRYNQLRGAGELSTGSAQMNIYTSAMIRDVAIAYMERYDRYDLSKGLLEQIASYRPRDPRTLWALGKVYKTVGRTTTDRNKAFDYLQQAVQMDERYRYPYIRRDFGLMQARLGNTAGAIESIKSYIKLHQNLTRQNPRDLDKMYDYLLTFGDSQWTAPRMDTEFIKAEAPEPTPPPAVTPPPAAAKPPANTLRPQPPARPATTKKP